MEMEQRDMTEQNEKLNTENNNERRNNMTNVRKFKLEDIVVRTQEELFDLMAETYAENAIVQPKEFVLVKGEAPVMLLCHLDTVHKERCKDICISKDGNIVMSPQGIGGDDRCGVYAVNYIYRKAEVKPWILFCCDEETGCNGAFDFSERHRKGFTVDGMEDLKFLIEIDRKGKKDAVYYDCDNRDFEKYITSHGFETAIGSMSDISYVAPELGVAAVNLSSGYYNAHSTSEYINRGHLANTIQKVVEIVNESVKDEIPKYEYVEAATIWDDLIGYGYGGYKTYKGYDSYWNYKTYKDKSKDKSKGGDKGNTSTVYEDVTVHDSHGEIVPLEIANEYEALLMMYDKSELDDERKEGGDEAILELFDVEFGTWEDYLEDWYYPTNGFTDGYDYYDGFPDDTGTDGKTNK